MKQLENYQTTTGNFSSKKQFLLTPLLYVTAAIFQCVWPYILYKNFDQVIRWLEFPVIGWAMGLIFIGTILAILLLFVIGIKLFVLVLRATSIRVSYQQNRKRKSVTMLLIIGICADIIFSSILLTSTTPDKSAIVFACALLGGKILQANFEAIVFYFSIKNKKPSPGLVKTTAS